MRIDMTTPSFSWLYVDVRPSFSFLSLLSHSRANVTTMRLLGGDGDGKLAAINAWFFDAISLFVGRLVTQTAPRDPEIRAELIETLRDTDLEGGDKGNAS